jgi:hypothetical protein
MSTTAMMYEVAKTKQHDMLAQAQREHRGRQAKDLARAAQPRRSRRIRRMALQPQAQS